MMLPFGVSDHKSTWANALTHFDLNEKIQNKVSLILTTLDVILLPSVHTSLHAGDNNIEPVQQFFIS